MIAITGANGHLGQLVVEGLLEEVPANQIIAAGRAPESASRFAKIGVHVRKADYSRPETFSTALYGVKRLLLISASEIGGRFKLHKAVIDAAKKKGGRSSTDRSPRGASPRQRHAAVGGFKSNNTGVRSRATHRNGFASCLRFVSHRSRSDE